MKIHPLRQAYCTVLKERYGEIRYGDKSPERTEVVAQRVMELGLGYEEFVELAFELWDDFATKQGWSYPYWNVVTSDTTFERLQHLLDLSGEFTDTHAASTFEAELMFATSYIHWLNNGGNKPTRACEVDLDMKVRVAEHLCQQYGIPAVTSDLNRLAQQLGDRLG